MKIIWTLQAHKSYWKNYDFVQGYWGDAIADEFEFQTFRVFEIIQKKPNIGQYDEVFDCDKLLIVKQITLLYELINDEIVLINFWDNRQKPVNRLNF